jgi:hypothetical protein
MSICLPRLIMIIDQRFNVDVLFVLIVGDDEQPIPLNVDYQRRFGMKIRNCSLQKLKHVALYLLIHT